MYVRTPDLPTPKGNEEAPPRKEKRPPILVDRVEHRNRPSLVIDWIDLWGLEQGRHGEAHRDAFSVYKGTEAACFTREDGQDAYSSGQNSGGRGK